MSEISSLFKKKNKNIVSIYFTAGFPNLTDTVSIAQSLEKSGADLIEIGIPFSDPLADGPTIQEAGNRALENGMSIDVLFEQLNNIKQKINLPIVLMGYFNPILQYGVERFLDDAKKCGIDGLIIPDLPLLEYQTIYKSAFEKRGIDFILLITPHTSDERIRKIDELSSGFIYMVADSSITGKSKSISKEQTDYFKRIQAMQLKNPVLAGFGISDKQSFSIACQYCNGAIIGSAFIRHLSAGKAADQFVPQIIS